MSKVEIKTFGCRLNSYESAVIATQLDREDAEPLAVFNTCAVTKEAERQARQAIRQYHRKHPEKSIVVTGCAAQIDPEAYAKLPGVTRVVGNDQKFSLHAYQLDQEKAQEAKIVVGDIEAVKETAGHLVAGFEGRARAFVQVQNGCNHRCTFCIIPYGRGNSRSVPLGEVVKQMQHLVEQGYQEMVLTGVDMTAYGQDLPGGMTLGQMVKRVLKLVPDLPRLRLSSVDVAEIDADLLDVIAENERFMPHLHISLQSGDDMILKRMKRRHTRQQVLDFCAQVRRLRPEVVFGADIIAGFPTETDAQFRRSLDLVEEAPLTYVHGFSYSKREGTPAARIPESKQVPVAIRKARTKQLRAAAETQHVRYLKTRVGQVEQVVVEQNGMGRSEGFARVRLLHPYPEGSVQQVRVGSQQEGCLVEA